MHRQLSVVSSRVRRATDTLLILQRSVHNLSLYLFCSLYSLTIIVFKHHCRIILLLYKCCWFGNTNVLEFMSSSLLIASYLFIFCFLFFPPKLRHISSEWHKKKNECSKVTYHRNGLLNLNRQECWLPGSAQLYFSFSSTVMYFFHSRRKTSPCWSYSFRYHNTHLMCDYARSAECSGRTKISND